MPTVAEQIAILAQQLEKGYISRPQFEAERDRLFAERPPGSGATPPPSPVAPPTSIGAYKVIELIGLGGMGAVYRARHRSEALAIRQGGEVAIKVMHAHLAVLPGFSSMFEREAAVALVLEHPAIVRTFDLIVDGGVLALVMEYVVGRPLSRVIGIEKGPIPWDQARPLAESLLDAVEYAHQHGIIHRDLKPENVIVTQAGGIKVLDFGIAKEVGTGRTKTGAGMGTPAYMAPEQYTDAKRVDRRADIYALGMTLYEMLAGRLPWERGTSEFELLTLKHRGVLPLPTEFYPYIPPSVVEAVMKALSVDSDERFETTRAFLAALSQPGERVPWSSGRATAKREQRRAAPQAAPQPAPTPRPVSTATDAPPPAGDGRGRCSNCGGPLEALDLFCPGCGEAHGSWVPCGACGAEVGSVDRFCHACGARCGGQGHGGG